MATEDSTQRTKTSHIRRNILTGTLTIIPLWVTWIVFKVVLTFLSEVGSPWVQAIQQSIGPSQSELAKILISPTFQYLLGIWITVSGLYVLGWLTTKVIGRKLFSLVDLVIERIPFVQTIYIATKKLLSVLKQDKTNEIQRVVLINFPSDSLKTVGFVTATMNDSSTGEKLAAVYVPTTPNPTSGYLEIVPTSKLVETNWSFDQAMTFVMSGGAVAPESITFQKNPSKD